MLLWDSGCMCGIVGDVWDSGGMCGILGACVG